MVRKGIDVSTWQGTIDWERVRAAGIEFAIIRAGFGGNNLDTQFARNISECNRLGIPCGVYWFSYALNEADAAQEAEYCLAAIAPYRVDYPVFFDFEYDSTRYAQSKGVKVTRELVTKMAEAFCERVVGAGYTAGVYTNLDYSRNMLDLSKLSAYELWWAWWADAAEPNREGVCVWQYTSKGRVDGIAGNVDLDLCFKSFPPEPEIPAGENPADETPGDPDLPVIGAPGLDNTPDEYALPAVEKAVEKGILKGNEHGDLMLHAPLLRQDLFVVLDRLGLL